MKKVVVMGGGFTGANTARLLEKKFDVTLIDTKEYFEFTPSVLKSVVEPSFFNKIKIFHKDYLKNSKIVIGKVSRVASHYVSIRGRKIFFDYLVISAGSYYPLPAKGGNVSSLSRIKNFKEIHERIEKAKKIAVIGGGVVGTELASELAIKYPGKEISVFTFSKTLLERNSERTKFLAENFLRKKGVRIFFNKGIIFKKSGVFIKGEGKINADYFFVCTGIKLNTGFLKNSPNIPRDKRGGIIVNDFLHVNGLKNIFAGGDLTGISEEKTAQSAVIHAQIISKNIINLNRRKSLKKYNPKRRIMVISLGRFSGILEYKSFSIGGLIPGILKKLIEVRELFRLKIGL